MYKNILYQYDLKILNGDNLIIIVNYMIILIMPNTLKNLAKALK